MDMKMVTIPAIHRSHMLFLNLNDKDAAPDDAWDDDDDDDDVAAENDDDDC